MLTPDAQETLKVALMLWNECRDWILTEVIDAINDSQLKAAVGELLVGLGTSYDAVDAWLWEYGLQQIY
jgi:hypothetical protein